MDDQTRRASLERTSAGCTAFEEWIKREAREMANVDVPYAFVLSPGPDGKGEIAVVALNIPTPLYTTVLRDIARPRRAVAVGLFCESWAIEADPEGTPDGLTAEAIDAWKAAGREVREHPRRFDVVNAVVDHAGAETVRLWQCRLSNLRAFGPWEDVVTNATGNLCGPWLAR